MRFFIYKQYHTKTPKSFFAELLAADNKNTHAHSQIKQFYDSLLLYTTVV